MKRKFIAVICSIVLSLSSSVSLLAQDSKNINILEEYFLGDTNLVKDEVIYPKISKTSNEFKLTLEQVLSDEHNVMVIISLEALTDKAKEILKENDESTNHFFNIHSSFTPVSNSKAYFSSFGCYKIEEYSTENKQYWACDSDGVINPDKDNVLIYLNKRDYPNLFVEVPLKNNLETEKIKLNAEVVSDKNEKFVIEQVDISPLSFKIKMSAENFLEDIQNLFVFFRMKNGEIKTLNQVSNLSSISKGQYGVSEIPEEEKIIYGINKDKDSILNISGRFSEITDIDEFEGIIIGNTEYSIKNTKEKKSVKIDKHLFPFVFKPVVKNNLLVVPLEDFCKIIGAEYIWNEENQSAEIKYSGNVLKTTVGSSILIKNGQEIEIYEPTEIYNEKLVVSSNLLSYGLNMAIEADDYEADISSMNWIVRP